ncbi:MAG TPA: hypothetical protein VKZ67_10780 [Natronosporangium sp.]|jgi:hypothetical protein|nr:hypothetical protein [Natronosporangium sp.]
MKTITVHLHGGPLDGTTQPAPVGEDGNPPEWTDFDFEWAGDWYAQYRRAHRGEDGWHFQATGIEKKADEE